MGLLGKKTILNEFIAYLDLKAMLERGALSERAEIIVTYASCGFSNLGSIAIQIGGIAAIAPDRQIERKHLTLRTRIKRLQRKTICFSKKSHTMKEN